MKGGNGFVCMVKRRWSALTFTPLKFHDFVCNAKIRVPIFFDPLASRTVLPLQELRTLLAMGGKKLDRSLSFLRG